MITPEEVFQIGRITRTHGIHGEVELQFTDDIFDRADAEYLVLRIDGLFVPFFFEEYRFKNNEAVIIKFEEVEDDAAARQLVGLSVYYPQQFVDEEEHDEINNLQAFTGFSLLLVDEANTTEDQLATYELGTIVSVNTSTANTLLTVETEEGEELLIPLHDDFLVDYSVKDRYLLLNLPEGILELNA